MKEALLTDCVFILRIILAGLCGLIIGYERKSRGKGAGIRTHLIVALAAALMMIVSKYGFNDIVSDGVGMRGADPSRIASQVVSGIGFLGAGMIYFSKHIPQGLTTAAGIWATAGIGLAMGAGMYVVAVVSTIIIILLQILLHKNLKILNTTSEQELIIVTDDTEEAVNSVRERFEMWGVHMIGMSYKKIDDMRVRMSVEIETENHISPEQLMDCAAKHDYIKEIELKV